jgi:hypothetical protein
VNKPVANFEFSWKKPDGSYGSAGLVAWSPDGDQKPRFDRAKADPRYGREMIEDVRLSSGKVVTWQEVTSNGKTYLNPVFKDDPTTRIFCNAKGSAFESAVSSAFGGSAIAGPRRPITASGNDSFGHADDIPF